MDFFLMSCAGVALILLIVDGMREKPRPAVEPDPTDIAFSRRFAASVPVLFDDRGIAPKQQDWNYSDGDSGNG